MIRIASSMTESSSPADQLELRLEIVTKLPQRPAATKPFSLGDETKPKQNLRKPSLRKKGDDHHAIHS
jgi:hypothetical protein